MCFGAPSFFFFFFGPPLTAAQSVVSCVRETHHHTLSLSLSLPRSRMIDLMFLTEKYAWLTTTQNMQVSARVLEPEISAGVFGLCGGVMIAAVVCVL